LGPIDGTEKSIIFRQVTMPNHAIELKVAPKAAETKAVKTSVKEGTFIHDIPLNPDWFIDVIRIRKIIADL